MKTKLSAILVLAVALCVAWKVWPMQLVQTKMNSEIVAPPAHFSVRKPFVRKVDSITEFALKEIGLSSKNSVKVVVIAYKLTAPSYHRVHLACQMKKDNTFQYMVMSFRMEMDSSITSLTVDGKIIPVPEPIFGIPLGDGLLMKDVCLSVSTINQVGEYAGNGFAQVPTASRGDNLKVNVVREEFFVKQGGMPVLAIAK